MRSSGGDGGGCSLERTRHPHPSVPDRVQTRGQVLNGNGQYWKQRGKARCWLPPGSRDVLPTLDRVEANKAGKVCDAEQPTARDCLVRTPRPTSGSIGSGDCLIQQRGGGVRTGERDTYLKVRTAAKSFHLLQGWLVGGGVCVASHPPEDSSHPTALLCPRPHLEQRPHLKQRR